VGVPGAPYGLLLPRSHDFDPFSDILKARYRDPVDRINLLQVRRLAGAAAWGLRRDGA
jgi:hypothetical protein